MTILSNQRKAGTARKIGKKLNSVNNGGAAFVRRSGHPSAMAAIARSGAVAGEFRRR
jgi:hypothetical protein